MQGLPEKLRVYRRDLGLTQAEVAIKLGVSVQTVHRWEHGTKPNGAAAKALSKLLR